MIKQRQQIFIVMLYCLQFGVGAIVATATATTPPASTTDATLTALATAAGSITTLTSDPQNRMKNYIQKHLKPAATSLASVCNMTSNTFSGQPSDQSVVFGVANSTSTTFMILQGNDIIGQIVPGWNGDVVLNLTMLSSGITGTGALPSFKFVPENGPQSTQLVVRVMTGAQLFTHINSISSAATTAQQQQNPNSVVNFYKNGTNPLPGAGAQAAVASDVYLVVENESITQGQALSPVAKRIHVLNLSNVNAISTISLALNNLGLVLNNNTLTSNTELAQMYSISIQGVHVVNQVAGHNVPILMMPRSVYQAGSTFNKKYASYVQNYALSLAKANAGAAPVYYDLNIDHSVEPFEVFRLLHYFNAEESLFAVVDQNALLPSGQVIGQTILTDVYGAYADQTGLDLAWVACSTSGFDSASNDTILISFGLNNAPNPTAALAQQLPQNALPGQEPVPGGWMFNGLQPFLQDVAQARATQSQPDQTSAYAYAGFPITNVTSSAMKSLSNGANPNYQGCLNVHAQNQSSLHWNNGYYGPSVINTGDPTNVVPGQSYGYVGSIPSPVWAFTAEDWAAGLKMVPVFYDANTCRPFRDLREFNLVNTNKQSSLYFYIYRGTDNKFLGLMPALSTNVTLSGQGLATFTKATQYTYLFTIHDQNIWCFQSPKYDSFGVMLGSDVTSGWNNGSNTNIPGFTFTGQINTYYPGYCYFVFNPAGTGYAASLNKLPNMQALNTMVDTSWATSNVQSGAWFTNVSQADAQAGVIMKVQPIGNNSYQLTLLDGQNNILGFQKITPPAGSKKIIVGHIASNGALKNYSRAIDLTAQTAYFKIMDTPQSGIILIPTTKPVVAQASTTTQTPATSGKTASTTSAGSKQVAGLQAKYAAAEKEIKALKAALAAQG